MNYSIITATLDSARTLKRTIDSVFSQSPLPCEYIFIDGGSKDGTLDIIASIDFASRGVKLTVESQKDRDGIYGAINQGIRASRGDIIFILHSDDWLEPGAAEAVLAKFAEEADCGVVRTSAYIHANGNRRLKHQRSFALLPVLMPVIHPAAFVRRFVYDELGLYDGSFTVSADYDFFYRLYKARARFCEIRRPLVNVRLGGYANSHRAVARKETLKIGLRHCRSALPPLLAYIARLLSGR